MFPVSDLEVVVAALAGRVGRLDPEHVAEVDAHKVTAVGLDRADAAEGSPLVIITSQNFTHN